MTVAVRISRVTRRVTREAVLAWLLILSCVGLAVSWIFVLTSLSWFFIALGLLAAALYVMLERNTQH